MIPLGTLVNARYDVGPMRVDRYNLFPTAKILGESAPGYSSGQALQTMEKLAEKILPPGITYEWTNMAYQEKKAAGKAAITFIAAILVVILILAGLYESWADPISVVLIVPLAVLGAAAGLLIGGMDNNVYTQVGLVLLVGLSAKNAILIVEFAKAKHDQGSSLEESALESARLRFRPILMTAFAFILGVVPLMLASGAGSGAQNVMGTAVFWGMLIATALGVFIIPGNYTFVEGLGRKRSKTAAAAGTVATPGERPAEEGHL